MTADACTTHLPLVLDWCSCMVVQIEVAQSSTVLARRLRMFARPQPQVPPLPPSAHTQALQMTWVEYVAQVLQRQGLGAGLAATLPSCTVHPGFCRCDPLSDVMLTQSQLRGRHFHQPELVHSADGM